MKPGIYRLNIFFLLITLFLSSCSLNNEPIDTLPEGELTPDLSIRGHEYLKLLLEKQYGVLSDKLAPHLSTRSDGNSLEMAFALEALSRPETWLESYFDEWVEAAPGNAVAHIARANYLMRAGIRARGTDYIGNTPESKLIEMRRLFKVSLTDLEKAKSLNGSSAYPYAIELEIAMRQSGQETRKRIYQQGRQLDPSMIWLHSTYLSTLAPKWGGSNGQQEEFLKNLRTKYSRYPWLKSAEASWMLNNVKAQPGKACDKIDAFRQVYEFYSTSESSYYLGKAYSCARQLEKALPYLQASVRGWPYNAHAWRVMGAIQHSFGDHQNALTSVQRSALVDPTDHVAFFQLGEVLLYLNRYQAALEAFQKAQALKPEAFRYEQYVDLAERFIDEPNTVHELVILETSSGPMVSETQYENGRKEGKAIFYKDNRASELKFYDNDVLKKVQRLSENEDIVTLMNMRNGVADGPFKEYSAMGNVISSGKLDLGKADGEIKVFFENGKPIFSNFYRKGEQIKPTRFWIPSTEVDGMSLVAVSTSGLTRLVSPADQNHRFDYDSGRPIFIYVAINDPEEQSRRLEVRFLDASGRVSFQHKSTLPPNVAFKPGYVYYTPNPAKDTKGAWTVSVLVDDQKATDIDLVVD